MVDSTRELIWTELARELIDRPDVRPSVKRQLEQALDESTPERAADRIREVLSRSMSAPVGATQAVDSERQERSASAALAQARQALTLIEHGMSRLTRSEEIVPARLCSFFQENVAAYAEAVARAGAPTSLEAPEQLASRVLSAVAEHKVLARPTRIGVLSSDEVSAIAAGRLDPTNAPTIVASGDLGRDIERWQKSGVAEASRHQAIETGDLRDGQYLLALIEPTSDGRRLIAHPLTADGRASSEPIESVVISSRDEAISATSVMVTPAVRSIGAPALSPVFPDLGPGQDEPDLSDIVQLRHAAIEVNRSRIELYNQILEGRGDLPGASRRDAEQRLERMQKESESVAGELRPARLDAALAKWNREISRDISSLSSVAQLGTSGDIEALARLGALRHRMEGVLSLARGLERNPQSTSPASSEAMLFATHQEEAASIFDGLSDTPLTTITQPASEQPVSGEALSADVIVRDAARSNPPSAASSSVMREIAEGGQQLKQALSTMGAIQDTGLSLSASLMPLLRAEGMPDDFRPDMRSPLLRQVLLPAMQAVSGRKSVAARRDTSAPASPALSPGALYTAVLGKSGETLAKYDPGTARGILAKMGAVVSRQMKLGKMPGLATLQAAGAGIQARTQSFMDTGNEIHARSLQGDVAQTMEKAIEASPSMPAEASAGPLVQDVSRSLEQESGPLSADLMSSVEPYVEASSDQRIISGAVSDMALAEMGALGATVGDDVYLRSDLSGPALTAVLGHELTHVASSETSVERQEEEAYGVEAKIRRREESRQRSPEWELARDEDASDAQLSEAFAAAGPATEADPKTLPVDRVTDAVLELMGDDYDRFGFVD